MEELVTKAQNGDKNAFTELILFFEQDLYKIAKMRLFCEADIEDAIQETMIHAFNNIHKLQNPTSFKYWIIKILINECNKIYRKQNSKNVSIEEQELEKYLSADNSCYTEDDVDFYLLIQSLNYEERMVITLYYLHNYTTKEIGKLLKMNENTVKTKISRAKLKLKNIYEGGEKIGSNR